jgi:thiol-disulfide isomerase/thioredoxin
MTDRPGSADADRPPTSALPGVASPASASPALEPHAGPASRRRTLLIGGAGVAAVALAAGVGLSMRRLALDPADRQALEIFHTHNWTDSRGQAFDAQALRGRPMILNFWATWCPPCVEEMPELGHLQSSLGGAGLQVIGIGIDSAERIEAFRRKVGLDYALLVAGAAGAELGRRFGNASGALPFTVVLDRRGLVRDRILGRFVFARLEALARAVTADPA